MKFHAEAVITPRAGVLDTQGKAVEKTLGHLGYAASNVRIGRIVNMDVEAADKEAAVAAVKEMCQDVLANELIETFNINLQEA